MQDINFDIITSGFNTDVIQAENTSFRSFANKYIDKIERGEILTPKKVKFSSSSIRQYRACMLNFVDFEKLLPRDIELTDISTKLMKQFEIFLIERGLSLNSVSAYISKIKAIANILLDEEIISYRRIKISTPKERTTKIYLSMKELKQMNDCKTLTDGERKVLDLFLISSFTAMRYSTLKKFLKSPYSFIKESNGNSYISITADKTQEESVIPLSRIVVDILKKYNGEIDTPSDRYVNQTLKKIGKKSKINALVPHRITKGGEMVETLTEKYNLISTHTARRNLISNATLTDMNHNVISVISGHNSVEAMRHYCRVENIDKIKDALNHPFFKQTL